jgi:RNA polymerase sigma factor for flagellar operon FliA
LKNQRAPSDGEIAEMMGVGVDQVQKALVDSSRVIVSLDASRESEDEEEQSLHEIVPDETQQNPSDILFQEETMAQLVQALHGLDQREQLVLTLYYYEKLTFKEIGQVMDITESRVCQLHARSITLLRSRMQQQESNDSLPAGARKMDKTYLQGKPLAALDRRG